MASQLPNGRFLLCPTGSHLAMYDDDDTYRQGLIDFIYEVETRAGSAMPDKRKHERRGHRSVRPMASSVPRRSCVNGPALSPRRHPAATSSVKMNQSHAIA